MSHDLLVQMAYSPSKDQGFRFRFQVSGRTPDATSGCLTCNVRQFTHEIIIFLSVKIVFCFHLLTKERLDPYFIHLVM